MKNQHTDIPPLGQDESEEDTENVPLGCADESGVDCYADLPSLVTDSPDTDTDDTGYEETGDSDTPDIWIEDSLIHNTELDNFIQAAVALVPNNSPDTME